MADNIKIVGNIISTTTVSRYSNKDKSLIPSSKINEDFGGKTDYIEFYIYDAAGNLLSTNYNYLNYKLPTSTGLTPGTNTQPNSTGNIPTENTGITSTLASTSGSIYPIIEIDPVQDLQDIGYSSGEFNTRYNLFTNVLSNSVDKALFIKEISPDRTELRLGSVTLTNDEIESTVTKMIDEINNSSYYIDYLLNFGNNIQILAINIALNKAPEGYEVLFKLYEPLPVEIQNKMILWIVEEKTTPYVFDINLDKLVIPAPAAILRGPNFDIPIPNQGTVSTVYADYSTALFSLQSLQSSSYNQILNLMSTQSIHINVDYTDFDNFVFFGSAYNRVSNFYTKVQQIENYTNLINLYTPYIATTASLQTEINRYSSSINNIISQLDGYESYLYFESSSYTWPKSGSLKPFSLLSTGSAFTINWYNTLTGSANNYDENNYDNLKYVVPTFIREDGNNASYLTFLNMIGHYFDNIWIYLKAITDVNLANNNLNAGISKDLVYNQLQSLGIKLYNSQAGEALDQFLVGANTGSSIFDNDFSITGSYLNNIPRKDLLAELYKRIYHNLPLLLKTKGTKAGLENLITTFGIPSRTYTSGSSISSSILDVKEYGGSLKSSLIKGYNDEKVRIVTNTIVPGTSGDVLSPLLSLQTYPTLPSQFRDSDMNYVDISFSPETQIDTYISGAIVSNNPTWSLDDYIGNPRQQYSSSYFDLDTQRKLYFETGVPGFAPLTASSAWTAAGLNYNGSIDYNGFIRLIQFFDNALFKMLGDFVPERTSLSTGVTINSPVLERNKISYARPNNSTTQSIQTAQYSIASISSSYGTFYNKLSSSNNTMGWFDGELSGSTVDVHQYFVDNYNPYLGDWSVYNSTQPAINKINKNTFNHSDWNVLLNNISASVLSTYRNRIEYTGNLLPTKSLFFPAELQDSYLSLRSYNISRYEGSKLTSLNYNIYTDQSYTGSDGITIQNGDISYGKTAVIDGYSRKIGLFTQVASSSFLPKRNVVALKYLVDEFGGLTELNAQNINWPEVQRIYEMSTSSSIALFDVSKFGNQKSTNGSKIIFDSGYSYSPVLYGDAKQQKYPFDNIVVSQAYLAYATNLNTTNYYITGAISNNNYFQLSASLVTKLFPNIVEGSTYFTAGGVGGGDYSTKWPAYTVQEGGDHNIQISFDMTVAMPTYGTKSYKLEVYRKTPSAYTFVASNQQDFSIQASTVTVYPGQFYFTGGTISSGLARKFGTRVFSAKPIVIGTTTYPPGSTFYRYSGMYQNIDTTVSNCSLYNSFSNTDFYALVPSFYGYGQYCGPIIGLPSATYLSEDLNFYLISNLEVPVNSQTKTFTINKPSYYADGGDKFQIRLTQLVSPTTNITSSITEGSLRINSNSSGVGNYPFINKFVFSNAMIAAGASKKTLTFTQAATNFYDPKYVYLPSYVSGAVQYSSSLYPQYGDVDYPFQLKQYDIFSAYDKNGFYFESRIINIYTASDNTLRIDVDTDMSDDLRTNLSTFGNTNVTGSFLFLNRIDDETNVLLSFRKRPGLTSYGFLLPDNLAPDVINNIDTITKQVKQKLLSDQQGTTQ